MEVANSSVWKGLGNMVCDLYSLLLATLVLASPEGNQQGFRHPVAAEGAVEIYLDQGLARADGKIVDYWRSLDDHIVRIRKLEVPTEEGLKRFDVLVITQREGPIRSTNLVTPEAAPVYRPRSLISTSYVPNLFTYIRDFVYKTYSERAGTKNGDLVLKTLQSERDFLNGVSTMVVISDENDISKIHATFRIVRRGALPENQKLDVENNLEKNGRPPLPEPALSVVEYNGKRVIMGDWAELKTLAVDHSSKIDFVPFLLRSFDTHALYSFGQREKMHEGEMLPWGASHVVIEADAARAALYKKLYGFVVDESRSTNDLFVMTMPMEEFLQTIRSGTRNDSQAVQDYVATPPLTAWTPRRVLAIDERSAVQERMSLFSQSPQFLEPWERYAFGSVSFYETAAQQAAESVEPGYPKTENERLAWWRRWVFHRDRYYPRKGSDAGQQDNEAVARGFADPSRDPDPVFESRYQLYEHILTKPENFVDEIPAAIAFGIAHRQEYPQFDRLLAFLLTKKGTKHLYDYFRVEPEEKEGESQDDKEAREAALELQFKIYDDFYAHPPKDEEAIKLLRGAEIPYGAGRVLAKLPRLGPTDRKIIFRHTLFYAHTVKEAIQAIVKDGAVDELNSQSSRVSDWFHEGYSYRFLDQNWDIPELIKTIQSSKPLKEKKDAAEKLKEAVDLAEELDYILKVMKKYAKPFHDRLQEAFGSSIQSYRDAQEVYEEWAEQETSLRNATSSLKTQRCIRALRSMSQ